MTESGVVDPIRIPPWIREPAERWWREMPPLAREFVGLAALDIVGRSIGFLAPTVQWGYITPLSFVSAFVPHDLWILLPALLLIRRPDTPTATRWIYLGAVVVAVIEVGRGPVEAILYLPATATISVLVGAAAGLGLAAGWVLLGRGLAVLTPREPSQTVAGISNLAVAALGILAAMYLAEVLVTPGADLGDPALNQALTLSSLTGPIQVLGWAYLVWVVIRGIGDPRRPSTATTMAGVGAILAAFIVPIFSVAARLFGAIGVDLNSGSGFGEVFQIISWLGGIAGPALIVAAFALGLGEPPMPYVPPEAAAAAPEPTVEPGEAEAPAAGDPPSSVEPATDAAVPAAPIEAPADASDAAEAPGASGASAGTASAGGASAR